MNISLPIVYNKFQSVRVVYRNNFHPQTLYIMYKHITLPQCIMLCVFYTIFTLRKFNCARGVKIVFFIQTIFTLRIDSVPFPCISLYSNFFFYLYLDYFYTSKWSIWPFRSGKISYSPFSFILKDYFYTSKNL